MLLSKKDYYLFNPVWHPNGEWIYYLASSDTGQVSGVSNRGFKFSGSVWRIRNTGEDDMMVLEGSFACLTISHNGERLAFIKGWYPIPFENHEIIIADTLGRIIDTIRPTKRNIFWFKFNRTDTKIYYTARSVGDSVGYFRMNIDGTGEEFLFNRSGDEIYFDFFPNDSLYTGGTVPSFNPQSPNYVVYSVGGDLILKNLTTGEEDSLYVDPFGTPTYIDLPSWNPKGDKVVYSAGLTRQIGSSAYKRLKSLELWMVENIEIEKGGLYGELFKK